MNINRILSIAFVVLSLLSACKAQANDTVVMGAERMDEYLPLLKGKRVGLVVNHTSVLGAEQVHLLDTLLKLNVKVVAAFAPEHGFRGKEEYGATIKDGKDARTGVPIISLHGSTKKPTTKHLQGIDVVVFDIQDVGARFYTYISTMHYVMEACAENNKEFIVLDRPNPCDYVAGPVLKPAFRSFVGMHSIPVLHGCTVGELAQLINGEGWINGTRNACRLTVVAMTGWEHGQYYSVPIPPSPNLPNDQAIRLYASLCPFEATNISVGRGTTFPFQVIGAPGSKFGSFTFTPTSLPGFDSNPLHKDKLCHGIDLRADTQTEGFNLSHVLEFYRKSGEGPAFFSRTRWMDLLMGTDAVRKAIIAGQTQEQIEAGWQEELQAYREVRKRYLLY